MGIAPESRQHIEHVADESLQQLDSIAAAATSSLSEGHSPGPSSLASVNTFTSGSALQRLDQVGKLNKESYHLLAREPAIARVVVSDEEGNLRTYYICRTTPISGFPSLASYRAPVGRLASLAIGSEFKLPNGSIVEVLERAQLRPTSLPVGWDSLNSIVETEHFGPLTIESFRALLTKLEGDDQTENLLDQLLEEENIHANVIEGVRRSVITKMGLRDQPVLDQYQDEIFRLPLDQRLLILGPPGTGKTTTLIRRLGQKLDPVFLDETEKRLVEGVGTTHGVPHSDSWLMFTPTDLLKQYLKEAFNRERIPASDLRIRSWHDYRRDLARNVFSVLKTASSGGSFILKEPNRALTADAINRPIEWFTEFDNWQRQAFFQELRKAAQFLSEEQQKNVQEMGLRLCAILDRVSDGSLEGVFSAIVADAPKIQAMVSGLKEISDGKIKNNLNLQLNRNRSFLDELASYIDEIQETQSSDVEDVDEFDVDDEDDALATRTGRAKALNAYMQAVRSKARALASKRSLGKNSRTVKIMEWLGDNSLTEADQAEVGAGLLIQTNARRFLNPVKRYLDGISRRYRTFRRLQSEKGHWYIKGEIEPSDIHPLELDIILLAILRASGNLLSKPTVLRNIDSPAWSSLRSTLELYQNQILVDEATDFSPIQIACMAALAHPQMRSFFACGDFNQRLTTWGSRSSDDLKWVLPDLDIREITISYRQSRQLNELARAIIHAVSGSEQSVSLPAHMESEGVAPTLLEATEQIPNIVNWLADRIREIERFVDQFPSTAIFVNSEAEVAPIAEALNAVLEEHNIRVVACSQGQVMGHDNDVRVFDIQHIKGLEFEAVFFIAVDRLASLQPEIFDKYLYVGTTRAATYLGITCEDELPKSIKSLRPKFVPNWENPVSITS
jgi:hypothetical protein